MELPVVNMDPIQIPKGHEGTPSKGQQQRIISETTGLVHLKLSAKNNTNPSPSNNGPSGHMSLSPKRSMLNITSSSSSSSSSSKNRSRSGSNKLRFRDEHESAPEDSDEYILTKKDSGASSSRRTSINSNSLLSSAKKNSNSYNNTNNINSNKDTSDEKGKSTSQKAETSFEEMLLELAKKERRVVELENELNTAKKQLKEFEIECRTRMETTGMIPQQYNASYSSLHGGIDKNTLTTSGSNQDANFKQPVENDLLSKWAHKLKETTDELLQIGGVSSTADNLHHESRSNSSSSSKVTIAAPLETEVPSLTPSNKTPSLKNKSSFFQLGLDKIHDIVEEFYDVSEDEGQDNNTANFTKSAPKKKVTEPVKQGVSQSAPQSGGFFDRLKSKFNELTLYEEDEEEYDRLTDKTLNKMAIVDDFQDCSIITSDMEEDLIDLDDPAIKLDKTTK